MPLTINSFTTGFLITDQHSLNDSLFGRHIDLVMLALQNMQIKIMFCMNTTSINFTTSEHFYSIGSHH